MKKTLPFFLFAALLGSPELGSQETSYQGHLSFEQRQYESDGSSESFDSQTSIKGVFAAQLQKEWAKARLGFFFRDAYLDQTRDIFNLDETYLQALKGNWSLSAGTHVFNWRTLEVFSAVDTLNPVNFDNMEEIERMGLPSIVLTREFETSFLQLIHIPFSQAPRFPQGRNRQGLQVDLESPKFVTDDYESSKGDELFQYILRFKKTLERFDLDLHFAKKYDTAFPLIVVDRPRAISPGPEDLEVRPYFLPVEQYGLAAQGNYGEWLLKLEAARYNFADYKVEFFNPVVPALLDFEQKDHTRLAVGGERAHFYENNHSGVFYLEYMSVFDVSADEAKTLGAFQRDGMLGYRHSFNDFKGHEISLFVIHDLQDYDETLLSAGHKFRLASAWKLSWSVTVINAPKPERGDLADAYYGLKPSRESDNILATITRFF